MLRDFAAFLTSVALAPWYAARSLCEFALTVLRYYRNPLFRRSELLCRWIYLLHDPYAICRRYLRDFPEHAVQKIYGESFFGTLEKIARAVRLTPDDVVYELGCGRGRTVFWFHAFYRCRTVGIEINPMFVHHANRVKQSTGAGGVEFRCANLMECDYRDATLIYLYGTAFSDAAILQLVDHFRHLRPGTRIATVSYPLSDYTDMPSFELEHELTGRYLWGNAQVFIQRKI